MMYWHFNSDARLRRGAQGICQMKLKEKKERKKKAVEREREKEGRWRMVTNAQERFGRLSKTFIIFDANYQTP